MYANTRQFIRYLVSSNVGEVAAIFLAAALGMPAALAPVQLLWVNLVTDGLPATALGFNPADGASMCSPPRRATDPIVGRAHVARYLAVGAYVGAATVGAYAWWYVCAPGGPRVSFAHLSSYAQCGVSYVAPAGGCSIFLADSFAGRKALTMSLSLLVAIEMANALNAVSETASIVRVPPWRNRALVGAVFLSLALHFAILHVPRLAAVFGVEPLDAREWLVVTALALPVIAIDEAFKVFARRSAATVSRAKSD